VKAAPRLRQVPWPHYPRGHRGHEHKRGEYSLTASSPWVEFPILNGSHIWTPGQDPGPVRAIYNDRDRSTFDVVYHDPAAPRNHRGKFHPFTKGRYRPATRSDWFKQPSASQSSTSRHVPTVREPARPDRVQPPRACKVNVAYTYQRTVCITVAS
jgi:hypothetical protein